MNWDAIGAIGEILGAGAVVATLVYLAVQVRYAKHTAADANRLSRSVGIREMISAQKTIPGLMDAWVRSAGSIDEYDALADKLGLDREATIMVETHCQGWWWIHWAQWASTTTEKDLDELRHLVSEFYSIPPMSTMWAHSPYVKMLDPGFQNFVNETLGEK